MSQGVHGRKKRARREAFRKPACPIGFAGEGTAFRERKSDDLDEKGIGHIMNYGPSDLKKISNHVPDTLLTGMCPLFYGLP
jgi:hypothetical protein